MLPSTISTQLGDCTQRNWLWNYDEKEDNLNTLIQNNSSQKLYELTQIRVHYLQRLISQQPGKFKVVIVEGNPVEFLATFLAGVIMGVDLFLCDPCWQEQEWRQVLSVVQPDAVFGEKITQDLIGKVRKTIKNSFDQKSELSEQSLIMIPTGGTSGKIRFTMHSWSTLTASVAGFRDYFNYQNINSYCMLPLYHVSGLMQFMRSFLTQGNLIICPYKVVKTKQIILNKPDYFISLVPTQLQFLLQFIPNWLTQFRTVLLGGAPASRSLLNLARKYKIPLAPTYGMTETASQIVTLKPDDFLAGNYSSGQILPHAKINIESDINQSSDNKIGSIKINCSSLCLGYYPRRFTKSQLFTTDDLGYFDHQGYLHIVGRNSQKIITGGENVFPPEVEAAIWSTNLVKDICVIGLPDAQWGQVVTAVYIPLKSDHNLDLIKQKIQSQISKYKLPKNWISVNSLPRNNRGKINYQEVKAIAQKMMIKK